MLFKDKVIIVNNSRRLFIASVVASYPTINIVYFFLHVKYMKGYRKSYVAAGIILLTTSFLFLFPYIASIINRQYPDVTESPIIVTGLDRDNPLRLLIFAILFCSGIGLIVKGFV
jgi:hypothetical protein